MGNRIISIHDIFRMEKDVFFSGPSYKFTLKNGEIIRTWIYDEISILRIENSLHYPYSKVVSDKTKAEVSALNKSKKPVELDIITIVFDEPQTANGPSGPNGPTSNQNRLRLRNDYISDIINYHKLLVHRGTFDSIITKVLENKDEIYTPEFKKRFNDERDKFYDVLKNKTTKFTSKL